MPALQRFLRDELHRRDWSIDDFARRATISTSLAYRLAHHSRGGANDGRRHGLPGPAEFAGPQPKLASARGAAALERLAITGLTLKQIGERLSRTESWASKRLRVYADSVLSGYVQAGRLTPTVAEELLPVADATIRRDMADRASGESWSLDRARHEVRALRLDKQLSSVARQARDLFDLLSSIDASKLPDSAKSDLWKLRGRIIALGRGPVMPTIEVAQQAAGVRTQDTPNRKRRAGYKPRR